MKKIMITQYELYNMLPQGTAPKTFALLADIHDRDSRHVIEALEKAKPDAILIAGDLFERHTIGEIMEDGTPSPWTVEKMEEWMGTKKRHLWLIRFLKRMDGSSGEGGFFGRKEKKLPRENGYHFLREAVKIAPVYYARGNHEWYYTPEDAAVFEELGICRLDNAHTELLPGVKIGGLSTRYDPEWLDAFSQEKGKKILLMHHPDYYEKHVKARDRFDLILSGHVHGGQWRFFGRGILAPGQGFFPKYHHGKYETLHSKRTGRGGLIVSAGCCNTVGIPRFGNPCEVVLLHMYAFGDRSRALGAVPKRASLEKA